MLWIAFKFFYLRDGSQRLYKSHKWLSSCELLSNFSIFVMVRNTYKDVPLTFPVVNCFQIFLSSWWFATLFLNIKASELLWIAFKFFYLRDGSQPNETKLPLLTCCELLSNFSIFVMVRNPAALRQRKGIVVNCFQIFLSSWWFATQAQMHFYDQ